MQAHSSVSPSMAHFAPTESPPCEAYSWWESPLEDVASTAPYYYPDATIPMHAPSISDVMLTTMHQQQSDQSDDSPGSASTSTPISSLLWHEVNAEVEVEAEAEAETEMVSRRGSVRSRTAAPSSEKLRRNRAAATKSRHKKKHNAQQLESLCRRLGNEQAELSRCAMGLRDEVLGLKQAILMHSSCDCEWIQQYITRLARAAVASS